jgi:hypothetical protein
MGTCWNCNTQISLEQDQTNCDNCGEIIFYHCNNCSEKFEVLDKESKKKLEGCKLCGYFKCPHCSICSWSCKRFEWEREILKILRPEITQAIFPNLPTKIREVVKYLESEKISIDRKDCPERSVPISYAKSRIKSLLAKFEGFRVKDDGDRDAFIKRMNELETLEIGEETTVSTTREKGSYGQEYRDAFNLLVCLGKFEIRVRKKKDSEEEYNVFVRCEREPCKYLARDDLVITYCETCKKTFPKGTEYCDTCPPYKKGKESGQKRKLKERLNNKDTCQMYRGSFIGHGKKLD